MSKFSRLIFLFIFLIFLTSYQVIAQTTGTDKNTLYQSGKTELYQGNYLKATEIFQKLVASESSSSEFHYLLGLSFSNSGQGQEAITAFNKAIELDRDNIRAYAGLGETYARLGQREEAINAYNKALKIKPKKDDFNNYIGLGNVNDAVGRKEQALSAYQQAIKLNPEDAEAHFFLGGSYFDLGKTSESIEELNKAIKLKDNFAAAYTFLGLVYGQTGKFSEAVEPLKKAINLNSNDLSSRQFLGMVYVKLKDKNSAMKEYEAIKLIDAKAASDLEAEINKLQPETSNSSKPTTVVVTKKNDRIRIGVISFSNKSGRPVSTDRIRDQLIDLLAERNFDLVRLNGNNQEAIIAEANKNNCDYILVTEITELLLGNRAGASSGRIFNNGEDEEAYDVIVNCSLFAKGKLNPVFRLQVQGRAAGSPDNAVLSAIVQEAKDVNKRIRELN